MQFITAKRLTSGGFTLIEVLVVIAIISVLASVVITSVAQARIKARDIKRVMDLKEVQKALELYRSEKGYYPLDITPLPSPPWDEDRQGSSCWECNTNSYYDQYRLTDSVGLYLNPRPCDPSKPDCGRFNTNCSNPNGACDRGYWYKVDPTGQDYKMSLLGTIENPINVSQNMISQFHANVESGYPGKTLAVWSSEKSKYWRVRCVFTPPFDPCGENNPNCDCCNASGC